jgi:hypothetical protein
MDEEVKHYLTRLKGEKPTFYDRFLFSLLRGVSGTLVAISKSESAESSQKKERPSFLLHLVGVAYDFAQFYSLCVRNRRAYRTPRAHKRLNNPNPAHRRR